jgi:hypothetical protein
MILRADTEAEVEGQPFRLRVTNHTAGTLDLQGTLVEAAARQSGDWAVIQAALVNNTSYDVSVVYQAVRVVHTNPADTEPRLALAIRRS